MGVGEGVGVGGGGTSRIRETAEDGRGGGRR